VGAERQLANSEASMSMITAKLVAFLELIFVSS
jgi:hypothetical protein